MRILLKSTKVCIFFNVPFYFVSWKFYPLFLFILDVRKALKGLEKCAKKAVLGATRAAKRSLDSTQDSSNTLIANSPFKAQSPTRKKSTHSELGSTAFPVNSEFATTAGVGQSGAGGAGGAAEEVNCHHCAAGMVFGLALVLRIMNRYSAEGADKTQLLVRTIFRFNFILRRFFSVTSPIFCFFCHLVFAKQSKPRRASDCGNLQR